jgi:hypothetical protein
MCLYCCAPASGLGQANPYFALCERRTQLLANTVWESSPFTEFGPPNWTVYPLVSEQRCVQEQPDSDSYSFQKFFQIFNRR